MPELPEVGPKQHLPRVVIYAHTREGRVFRAGTIKRKELYA